ncbi:hypothetical protein RWE87_13825 [Sinorhizobium meliloti]|uniref:hypothetical protein n=1 Tax=Rhizobium meliloti TaxID=382 RepID=UPI00299DDEC0|nr:hypothetical protein [Sinorhizobium meliloti]
MQTPETTITAQGPKLPTLMIAAITWALIGSLLWICGFLNISFAWIVGPLAYVIHVNLMQDMTRRVVQQEMEKVVDAIAVESDDEYAVVKFEDATGLEGSLN